MPAAAPVVIELAVTDLTPQGHVSCPMPRHPMPAWSSHPRVYLKLDAAGGVQCPYCSAQYQLAAGQSVPPAGH